MPGEPELWLLAHGQCPQMPERISHQSLAIAPMLVCNRGQAFGTCTHRLFKHCIRVRDVHINSATRAAQGLRRPAAMRNAGILIGEEEQRVTDSHLCVHDLSVRAGSAKDFPRTESLRVKVQGPGCATYSQRSGQSMVFSVIRSLGIGHCRCAFRKVEMESHTIICQVFNLSLL